jgi:ribosomal protein S17
MAKKSEKTVVAENAARFEKEKQEQLTIKVRILRPFHINNINYNQGDVVDMDKSLINLFQGSVEPYV